ncbi:sensor histidine kinase [Gelidibacter sp.]|uniref:sensor histidine kinase n=1 Tax=Gelidibacter sp. TaxID=2018083 RepID=UPI002D1B0242|nr:histidine kinase [Gelidibacter sp.]HUH29735.1 histidine kinase [Gelidibacter sp.]
MNILSNKRKLLDVNLVLLLAGFYLLFYFVLIAKELYMKSSGNEGMSSSLNDFLIYNPFLDYIIVVGYMTIIAVSTKRFLNKKYSWVKIISIHTVFSIFIGMVIRLATDLQSLLTNVVTFSEYDIKDSINRFMNVIDLNFLTYFAMVFIVYTYYYLKQVKEAEKKQNHLEAQLVNTRIKMLSSQMQPHFLFNTLNSIAVLTDIDPGKAKDTIADLSDFLREILKGHEGNTIRLERELRILEYYLNILNVRFSDHLVIKREIDESLLQSNVPIHLLQPIIENSIKHGYSYNHTELKVLIQIYAENKQVVIKIQNNGALLKESPTALLKKGIGLSNINDRLKNLYDEDYLYEIRNKDDQSGVETILKIPKSV